MVPDVFPAAIGEKNDFSSWIPSNIIILSEFRVPTLDVSYPLQTPPVPFLFIVLMLVDAVLILLCDHWATTPCLEDY